MIRFGDTKIQMLRDAAKGRSCIRCGNNDGTTVAAHYTGVRRHAYGGGFNRKVHDLAIAHLCGVCHAWMDQLSRERGENNEARWHHSEEFQHLVIMTILRLYMESPRLISIGEP